MINLPIDGATDDTIIDAFVADLRKAAAKAREGGDAARAALVY
jgi:hypothetical protein